jgi:proton-coupled amino acid transporter
MKQHESSADDSDTRIEFTSSGRATFHIVKSYVGAGIFLLPATYQNGGYFLGACLIVLLTAMTVDVCLMLAHARAAVGEQYLTYGDVVGVVFGEGARRATNVSLTLAQCGWCVVYLQVAGGIFGELTESATMYYVVILFGWLSTLPAAMFSHHIAKLALASMASTACGVVIIFVTLGAALSTWGEKGAAPTAVAVANPMSWPVFIPQVLAALAGIAPMLPVYNSIDPGMRGEQFDWLYASTVSVVGLLYLVYGALGYLAYGDDVHQSLVSSLPHDTLGNTMRATLAFALLSTYPIQYVPAIEVLDQVFGVPPRTVPYRNRTAVLLRLGSTAGIALVALFVGPRVADLFMGLVGASVVVALLFVIPPLLSLYAHKAVELRGLSKLWRLRAWAYVVFGAFVVVAGMTLSVQRIVERPG